MANRNQSKTGQRRPKQPRRPAGEAMGLRETVDSAVDVGRTAAQAGSDVANEAVASGRKVGRAVAEGADRVADTAQRAGERVSRAARESVEATSEQLSGVLAANRSAVDALVNSGLAVTRGVEDLSNAWVEFGRSSVEDGAEAAKALLQARTLRDLVEVQSRYSRTSFDRLLNDTQRLTQLSLRLADEAFRPLQQARRRAA